VYLEGTLCASYVCVHENVCLGPYNGWGTFPKWQMDLATAA
jgi:hypothetical protein